VDAGDGKWLNEMPLPPGHVVLFKQKNQNDSLMPRYIAFLRAINVGGHNVPMEALRSHFSAMGFRSVETFIASGNVIFETASRDTALLEKNLGAQLERTLGYEVVTFVRTPAEVSAIAKYQPFDAAAIQAAGAFCVGFLTAPPGAAEKKALMELKTDIDDFHVHGRELYWLCKVKQSDSKFSNALFERKVKVRSTFRGMNTIAKLAAKYGE
jgi:uncharacterized protein (DUF1697 family)